MGKKKEVKAAGKPIQEYMLTVTLERSKLNREKSLILLDKGMLLYFSFIFIAVLGFINGYLTVNFLNALVLMSFGVLIVAITPYILTMHKEERILNDMLEGMQRGGKHG